MVDISRILGNLFVIHRKKVLLLDLHLLYSHWIKSKSTRPSLDLDMMSNPQHSDISWRLRSGFRAVLIIGGPGSVIITQKSMNPEKQSLLMLVLKFVLIRV